jgi:hypothetical protein
MSSLPFLFIRYLLLLFFIKIKNKKKKKKKLTDEAKTHRLPLVKSRWGIE